MRRYVNYELDQGTAIVTIDNPPVNALTREMSTELKEVFEELRNRSAKDEDPPFDVVILTAVPHKGVFVAGGDINLFLDLKTMRDGVDLTRFYHGVMNAIAECELPVICAMNGHALGGGTEIALACDIRIAGSNTKMGLVETEVGIVPGGGGTQRLPRLIGPGMAKKLIFTAARIDADEALRIGLVEMVVPEADVLHEAKKLAQSIRRNGPNAVRAAKMAIDRGLQTTLRDGLLFEQEAVGLASQSGEPAKASKAFLEKRKPAFGK